MADLRIFRRFDHFSFLILSTNVYVFGFSCPVKEYFKDTFVIEALAMH